MAATVQLQASFEQKIASALQVSEFLEQGQADMPLNQLFQQLRQDLHQKPFAITLLCLTEDSRQAALKWLYGHNFAVFSVQISSQVGLLEVHLKDRGYSVESSTGARQDFEQWDELVKALDDNALLGNEKADLRIGTQASTAIKHLNVLIPESPAFVQQSPALMTRILRDTNVLMVAAPPSYPLPETERKLINTLMEDMSCFIPLLPINELADDAAIPEHGWWEQITSPASLPVQLLTTHVSASLPSFLTHAQDDVRQSLLIQQLSKKYQSACDAVADQFSDTLRQLNSRKKREARKQVTNAIEPLDNQQQMRLRTRIGDTCSELGKAVEEASRKRELLTSDASQALKDHIDKLGQADLHQEDSYKAVKLTLDNTYQADLMNFMRSHSRRVFDTDVKDLQKELEAFVEELGQALTKQLGYSPVLTTLKFDKSLVWHDLEQVLAMEIRYQGEMPKRGLFDRLGAGRQAIMGLMMVGMVLGGLFEGLRQILMIFGLPLFFIGVMYSYINFPKDEAARMDKELKRVRDEVLASTRRLNSDVNRQKANSVRNYLDKLKKTLGEQVEKIVAEASTRRSAEQKKQADVASKRVQGIDQQLSDMQQQQLNLGQLKTGATQLLDESLRVLKGLA